MRKERSDDTTGIETREKTERIRYAVANGCVDWKTKDGKTPKDFSVSNQCGVELGDPKHHSDDDII